MGELFIPKIIQKGLHNMSKNMVQENRRVWSVCDAKGSADAAQMRVLWSCATEQDAIEYQEAMVAGEVERRVRLIMRSGGNADASDRDRIAREAEERFVVRAA